MSTTATLPRNDPAARVADLVSYIQGGRIHDAMLEFYADDVQMQENNNPPTAGLAANVEREKQFVASVKQWKSLNVETVAIDAKRNRTVVQSNFSYEDQQGRLVQADQVAVQQWRDGKIVHEKFYYDSAPAKS
jgi:ketosteroid isomerase-like protein